MRRYTVLLIPDQVDGGYTVTVPTLPGCVTEGDTLEEALDHARDAIRLYLADLEDAGEPAPEERVPPALATVEA
jgi:predicted RNase H-like HicB family nuclease